MYFSFLFNFSIKIGSESRIAPDGTPRFAASHLGLFRLPMSHENDTRLMWVNVNGGRRTSIDSVGRKME